VGCDLGYVKSISTVVGFHTLFNLLCFLDCAKIGCHAYPSMDAILGAFFRA